MSFASASSAVSVSASASAKAMKNIPQKYLKYMSYGLYLLKRICPHPEEYSARAIELLKLHNTVEEIVHDIDFILEGPLKTEMHEIQTIRKNFAKPPKKSKLAKDKPLAAAIVECAQQSTVEHIVAMSESESESEVKAPVSAPVQKKLKKVAAVTAPVEPIAAAEQAVRNALADDKQKKEQEKAKKEAEKAQKEQEKEAEKLRKEQEKEAEKLRKEQEKAQKEKEKEAEKLRKEQEKEAEKLKKEQEKAQKEQEKEAEKARKEAEKAKKEQEKASKVKTIKPLTAELTAEPEK